MKNKSEIIHLIPFVGIIVFISLYIFSSTLYPGGSQADLNSEGFDWIHNYWCNLMNDQGMNGEANPAKLFSIFALVVLCLSLMVFFVQFARTFPKTIFWKRTIMTGGIFSMTFAILMFTQYHDLMTIISSVFGLVVVVGIIKEIYQSNLTFYKITGCLCILLLAMNNYIYYSTHGITCLPLLQKITFAVVLAWISGLNYEVIKKRARRLES